nr:hypothetical protein [Tanacetum cinerariifolium]
MDLRYEVVDNINEHLLEKFPGEEMVYLSCDSVDKTKRNAAIDQSIFSPEFINGLKFSGILNHMLTLEVGVAIMLRNIDQPNGLCNRTRLQVLKLTRTSISAQIINGTHFGKKVIIPRLRITPFDKRSSLKIVRKQFPLSVSFAMTINKSQVMENDASNMSYIELISWVEEEAGNLKSLDKHVVAKCKSHVNKIMDKGKNPVRKIVDKGESLLKNNGIVIEKNVNPVTMDTDSDCESESEAVDEFNYTLYTGSESDYSDKSVDYLSEGEDELIDLRKRKTEAKKAPKKSNSQTFPVNEGTSTSNSRQMVYGVRDSETLMEHEEFMDDDMCLNTHIFDP